MFKSILPFALSLMATITLAPTAQAQVFFDGFLTDNAGQPANNFNGFIQWDVTNGTVDLVGGNVPGVDDPALGGRFVDLDGSSTDAGSFATKMPMNFAGGLTFTLSFIFKSTDGNPNAATAMIGPQVVNFSTSGLAFQQFSQTFSFPSLTSAKLVFQDLGNDSAGIGIDDVMIVPVPEPAVTSLLVAASALALVMMLRNQKRSTAL